MKKQLQIAALLSVVSGDTLIATTSEFRSPLRVIRGVMHAPLQPVDESWWYDQMPDCEKNDCWQIETWGTGYYRAADKAFFKLCDGNTTKTTSLSTLFFGKESFTGQEFFANGTISPAGLSQSTPFLSFAYISPRFQYTERGVVAGLQVMYTFGEEKCWHVGFRAGLPVKDIEVELTNSASFDLEETIGDVADIRTLCTGTGAGTTQTDFAFRLDFLTSLSQCITDSSDNTVLGSIVQYDNGTGSVTNPTANVPTKITGVLVSGTTASSGTDEVTDPPVYLTRVGAGGGGAGGCLQSNISSGVFPNTPYCKPATAVSAALNADGSGGDIGQSAFFQFGTNYAADLGLDPAAQAALFVVPRCDPDSSGNPVINTQANAIRQNIQNILDTATFQSATSFFNSQGIDFGRGERVVGVGDFDVEFYGGYGKPSDCYIDGILGIRFPTGTKPTTANRIYYQPTGNKHHFELKLGLEGGVEPCEWFGFHADAAYSHVFKAGECRSAPFKQSTSPACDSNCTSRTSNCSTSSSKNCNSDCCKEEENSFAYVNCSSLFVKNIGPSICVDVSWDYFVAHMDFSFFHPCNRDLGISFGYEAMYKSKDRVAGDDCDCTVTGALTATDLLGNTNQPLDLSILEDRTESTTHKLYAEIFHRWNFFELFAGASHIVAGENAMKESEIHLGMKLFF